MTTHRFPMKRCYFCRLLYSASRSACKQCMMDHEISECLKVSRKRSGIHYDKVTDPIVRLSEVWRDKRYDDMVTTLDFMQIGDLAFMAYQEAMKAGRV